MRRAHPAGDARPAVCTGPRAKGEDCFDARQVAALRDSRVRRYLHLSYRDARESLDRTIYDPVVDAWERALNAAGAAVVVIESFADTWFAQVTYSALKSPSRLLPNAYQAGGVAELEKLVRPVLGERAIGDGVPVQLLIAPAGN